MNDARPVPEKYKKLQKNWKLKESIWLVIHYGLGLSAASLAFLASRDIGRKFAIASGLVATILTFLSPASRRKAYTEACNLLRVTRMRFEKEGETSHKNLNDAVEKAQDIIAKR
jgi:hypothetical protein